MHVSDLNEAFFGTDCLFTEQGCTTIDLKNLTEDQRRIIEFSPYLKDALLIGQGGRRTISKVTPTFSLNSVDNPISPVTGRRYTASVGFAGLGGNTRYMNPTIEGVWFLQHTAKTTLGLRAQAEYIRPFGASSPLPIFERLVLGGGYSVRGYDLRTVGPQDPNSGIVIGGNKSLLFNAEYLISVGGPVRLILFYDAGQVQDSGQRFTFGGRTEADGTYRAWLHYVNGSRGPVFHARAECAIPLDLCVEPAAEGRAELQHRTAGEGVPIPVRCRFNFLTARIVSDDEIECCRGVERDGFLHAGVCAGAGRRGPCRARPGAGAAENGVPGSAAYRSRIR